MLVGKVTGWCGIALGTHGLLGGCADDDSAAADGGAGAGGDAGAGGMGFSCPAAEVPVPLTFHSSDYDGPALEGVHACIANHPAIPCVDTGSDGAWNLCAPAGAELAITYEKPEFMPTLVALTVGTASPTHYRALHLRMSPESFCSDPWDEVGVTCPPVDSLLFVKAVEDDVESEHLPGPLGDVTVTLEPPAELGPFYANAAGKSDLDATATHALNGNAFAAGLVPGDDQLVTLTHPTQSCRGHLAGSFIGSSPNTLRIPTRAGFRTFVVVTCE
jgi:hypothetical protein